ncbi:MAG TPA: hypothetical protein VM659_22600 [Dongiaceae bacterium]|nr:hypothetical protein [Dongiaceae bacterium]
MVDQKIELPLVAHRSLKLLIPLLIAVSLFVGTLSIIVKICIPILAGDMVVPHEPPWRATIYIVNAAILYSLLLWAAAYWARQLFAPGPLVAIDQHQLVDRRLSTQPILWADISSYQIIRNARTSGVRGVRLDLRTEIKADGLVQFLFGRGFLRRKTLGRVVIDTKYLSVSSREITRTIVALVEANGGGQRSRI